MSYANKAESLLKSAEEDSKVGVHRDRAALKIQMAEAYIKLAQIESNERLSDDFNETLDRKRFV